MTRPPEHSSWREGSISGSGIFAGRWSVIPKDLDCNIQLCIGNFTSIASGCRIVSGQHPPVEHPQAIANFPFEDWAEWCGLGYPGSKMDGRVDIGNDVWIGQDVHIMEGVVIGNGAIVAACSVVVRDVPDYAVVAGNPAKVKKMRFHAEKILSLQKYAWWDMSDEEIREQVPAFATGMKLVVVEADE